MKWWWYELQEKKTEVETPSNFTADSEPGCVVSGPTAAVLRASRVLGAAPLRVARAHAAWRVSPSPTLAVLQRLLITACNIVMLVALGLDFTQDPNCRIRGGDSTLKAVIWIVDMFLVMLIANLTVYMGPCRMVNLINVLNQLLQINFELKINPPSAKSDTMKSFAIICYLVWSTGIQLLDIYNLMVTAVKDNKMWPIMCMYFTYYYSNVVGVAMVLQWNCTARGTHAAAAAINQQLRQLRYVNLEPKPKAVEELFRVSHSVSSLVDALSVHRNTDTPMQASQAQATIRRLALAYDRISEVVTQMNAANGLILLVMILSIFLRLVLTPYYLLLGLFDDDDVVVLVVAMQVNWSMFHMINLILIVEPCHWTQEERDHTGHLLSQLTVYLAPKCERISKELDQFAKQVTLDNAQFRPLGIHTLARPLVATILGGVTTYLVIIMQFQKISDLL
ncbi:putative gustatory receptor 28b isoform X1 [Choristoneura fumiferana]|uniref:putative gustatory receptor 28b isoform X1 n=1 Tax=Choristoneura fumiferana TaxID=7141 RepID=UPI003D15B0A0